MDVGTYYINDELGLWVDEFTMERDFVSVVAWYAEAMAEDGEEPDCEGAESEFEGGYYQFKEIEVGPFYIVLNYDINEDATGSEGIYAVYICREDFYESYLADVFEVYVTHENYQDALDIGKEMFAKIGDNNKYEAEQLYLVDAIAGDSDGSIDQKELSVDQG